MANLERQIDAFFSGKAKSGRNGLQIMHNAIMQIAQHGNTDPATRMIAKAEAESKVSAATVKTVFRHAVNAYFGDKMVIFRKDTNRRIGWACTLKFKVPEGEVVVPQTNHYGLFTEALEKGTRYDDKDFVKAVREAMSPKPEKTVEDKRAALPKTVHAGVQKAKEAEVGLEAYLNMVRADWKGAEVPTLTTAPVETEAAPIPNSSTIVVEMDAAAA